MPGIEETRAAYSLRGATPRAEPMVWLCSGSLVIALGLLVALLALLAVRGVSYFWPQPLILFPSGASSSATHLGVVVDREVAPQHGGDRVLVYLGGGRARAASLVWLPDLTPSGERRPIDALVFERYGGAPVFGFLEAVLKDGVWASVQGQPVEDQLTLLEALRAASVPVPGEGAAPAGAYRLRLIDGERLTASFGDLRSVHAPNAMSGLQRVEHFFSEVTHFLSDAPRESNSAGGVFPAIVGTVTLVLLMTVLVTPLGVLAAIYLQEYAQSGPLTRAVRVAVNNLAGVPSVVFGVFGLGFFVYGLGGSLDTLLFDDRLPAPTLGTPGMLWASLTMALLTLPVVVVTTEEGLARVPATLREGAFALGATRAETLWNVILPAASPALLTGLILAIARATGEVAPLLLVGVAKYAQGLPVDGVFPYLHLDRQFMHLGFYIYDLGFQSPDSMASEGLVFATALLLVLIVLFLNSAAVILRGRLREAFRPDETL